MRADQWSIAMFSLRALSVSFHCCFWTEMSDFHSSDHCKMKALGQHWISETKVKTRSHCAHDNSLMHAQTDIILNSFSFISVFPHICCQLHHQNASVPVSSLLLNGWSPLSDGRTDPWSPKFRRCTYQWGWTDVINVGGRTQRRIVIWFRRGGIKFLIRNYFRCRSRGVVPQEHLTVI